MLQFKCNTVAKVVHLPQAPDLLAIENQGMNCALADGRQPAGDRMPAAAHW
jgi:hypothetical protein